MHNVITTESGKLKQNIVLFYSLDWHWSRVGFQLDLVTVGVCGEVHSSLLNRLLLEPSPAPHLHNAGCLLLTAAESSRGHKAREVYKVVTVWVSREMFADPGEFYCPVQR